MRCAPDLLASHRLTSLTPMSVTLAYTSVSVHRPFKCTRQNLRRTDLAGNVRCVCLSSA